MTGTAIVFAACALALGAAALACCWRIFYLKDQLQQREDQLRAITEWARSPWLGYEVFCTLTEHHGHGHGLRFRDITELSDHLGAAIRACLARAVRADRGNPG